VKDDFFLSLDFLLCVPFFYLFSLLFSLYIVQFFALIVYTFFKIIKSQCIKHKKEDGWLAINHQSDNKVLKLMEERDGF
jgi:hypothetical protein